MEIELVDATNIQILGAYPLAFYPHFKSPEYIEPNNLFPLIPPINKIETIQKTKEDLEKRRQELFRQIKDMVLLYAHKEPPNKIVPPPKTTFKTKTLGDLIEVLI